LGLGALGSKIARATSPASTSTRWPTPSGRHRRALRAVALRRAAGGERTHVRSAALRRSKARPRSSTSCSMDVSRALVATHRPDLVEADRDPSPQRLRRLFASRARSRPPRPHAHRARRRLGQHRAAPARRARVFDYVDYVTLDDGEAPSVVAHRARRRAGPPAPTHLRARRRGASSSAATRACTTSAPRQRHAYLRRPAARPLPLARRDAQPDAPPVVLGALEQADHRARLLLEEVRFCDITLDYSRPTIARRRSLLVDRIEALIAETGETGFHFVDERRPRPACVRSPSGSSRARWCAPGGATSASRSSFTPKLAALLARSGCVALSGGPRVASDRLLERMREGVTVAQVARVTRALTDDPVIMVNAYLMYGFPTETAQETIDSLERVRQLFEAGCLQSAVWHRFAATAHSPIGQKPDPLRDPLTQRAGGELRAQRSAVRRSDWLRPRGARHRAAAQGALTTTCTASGSTSTCRPGSTSCRRSCVRRRPPSIRLRARRAGRYSRAGS